MQKPTDKHPEDPSFSPAPARGMGVRIAFVYAMLGALWVSVSGWLVHKTVRDGDRNTVLEQGSGWLLVVVSAVVLGVALERYFRRLRLAARRLQECEARPSLALGAAQMGAYDWDVNGEVVIWSERHEQLWGFPPGGFDGTYASFLARVHPDDRRALEAEIDRSRTSRVAFRHEFRVVWPDESVHWVSSAGGFVFDSEGRPLRMRGTVVEVTQRKQAERLQALSAEVLTILNDARGMAGATQRILVAIQRATGLEAVGIRLREGDDFPYAAAEGFSPEFLEAENRLAASRPEGGLCRDEQGRVKLECTCGLVLSGKTDPTNSLFTEGGSAWTNDARPFLHFPLGQDPRLGSRDRCLQEGYQSWALIPIRLEGAIIGLLQLNSRSKNCFTIETIRFFESITSSFGIALKRLQEEKTLRESQNHLRALFDAIPESVFLMNLQGGVMACNATFAARLGRTPQDCLGTNVYTLLPGEVAERRRRWVAEVVRTRHPGVYEDEREGLWLRHSIYPVLGGGGEVLGVGSFAVDITSQREALAVQKQKSELADQLASIAATVPGLIFSLRRRPDGGLCVPFATAALEGLCGVRAEEIRENLSSFMALIHPQDQEPVMAVLGESARTLTLWNGCFRLLHPEKGERWLEGYGVPRAEPDDGILWHGFLQDVTERVRGAKELETALIKYRTLFESFPLGITVTDQRGHIVETNRVAEKILGVPTQEHLRRDVDGPQWPIIRLNGTPMPSEEYASVRALKENRMVENVEMGIVRSAAETVWLSVSAAPIRMDGYGVVVTYGDISERRNAELRARTYHDLAVALSACVRLGEGLRLCLDAAMEATRLDSGGFYLLSEADGALELQVHRGLSPEFVRKVLRLDASSPQTQAVMGGKVVYGAVSHFKPALAGVERAEGLRFLASIPLRHENRVIGCLNLASHEVEEVPEAVLQTLETIAASAAHAIARLRSEEALSQSEQRFRTLVESAPMGIFIQTRGRFTYVNQAACQMFGQTAEQPLLEQRVLDRFPLAVQPLVRERIRLLNEESCPVPVVEHGCLRLDGSGFEAEFSAVPFVYAGERGALVFFQEVTERKRLEAQLLQAQKLEAIGQLAGGVAHDFNNILAAMMMHLGLLQMRKHPEAETADSLHELMAETRRAAGLTRQLLMFSRRSVMEMKVLDLNELVANLLKMLSRLIGEHIHLRFELTEGLPRVEADPGMLEQVLLNLAVNARDAMPKGGTLGIQLQAVQIDPERGALHPESRVGCFVCLAVADTGCGMDGATLCRVFEPFFTTKEAGKGTGLGLATVHGIVAQHRGWVEVESEVGNGTTFRVYLPAARSSSQESVEPERVLAVRGQEWVLVVEDEGSVRKGVSEGLRHLGYTVLEASNGQEAVRVWQSHPGKIDLLLTDMVMPEGMTGLELAEKLQEAQPRLKVILCSGYNTEMLSQGTLGGKQITYLQKPFEMELLSKAIRKSLEEGSGVR